MLKLAVGILSIIGGAVACSSDNAARPECVHAGVGPGAIPGVVTMAPGLDLQVRDPFGHGQAIGTTAVVSRTDGSVAPANIQDTLNILSAYNVEGTFTVTLTRPYYKDASIADVVVPLAQPGGCSVVTTKVPVTLQLAAGAPPVRAMTILGAEFLDHPGAQATLLPYFDANPDVSTAVTWQLNDGTLASVDANGVVTAKCTKAGGTVKVTATSVVDLSITSFVNLGVAPASSCP
jgi:hypothetical protein